jgi:hypothetical protein
MDVDFDSIPYLTGHDDQGKFIGGDIAAVNSNDSTGYGSMLATFTFLSLCPLDY